MNKKDQSKLPPFEVLEENDERVVFKRVLPRNNRSKKEQWEIEMQLPKLSLHYFDLEDLNNLKQIEADISGSYEPTKDNSSILSSITKYLLK